MAVIATFKWQSASGAEFSARTARTGVAHLQGYNASFSEWGEGRPLILIPGLAGGLDLLGPLARELARHFRVISYQLRGEEDCFSLRRRFDMADLVSDLRELIDWFGFERPIVCGVSFGGVLALKYASRFPQAVEAVAVQGVGARYERGLMQRIASHVLTGYPLPANNPFVNQFFNLLFGSRQESLLFDFVTRQCWQTDQSVMAHRLRLVERLDLVPTLGRIQSPVLALAGDRDLLVSSRSLSDLLKAIPQARGGSLKGCGHLAFVTHPEWVVNRFLNFLGQSD